MARAKIQPKGKEHVVNFERLRNISSPEDIANGRTIYSGQVSIREILDFPTNENVRDYLLEADGRQKRRPSGVHKAIKDTLINYPENFTVLNGGITIVANNISLDEKQRTASLTNPSIINGAQTQGVIKDLFSEGYDLEDPIHIKCEIIITGDNDLIGDISIARNYQNDVMAISIAGRRGQLDELEKRIQKAIPGARLRKSETQLPTGDYIDTEKLIQVIIALMPASIWYKTGEGDSPNKVFTYSQKSRCLKDFQDIYLAANNTEHSDHERAFQVYNYFLDVAPVAYGLYTKWKQHPDFIGTRLRSIERSDSGEIVEVPDGIIFPILASLSVFIKRISRSGWRLIIPNNFSEAELISAAAGVYKDIANSNPQSMGKNKACYSALLQITTIYARLLREL